MSELVRYVFDFQPRCTTCNKLLAEKVTQPWTIRCGRCKHENRSDDYRKDKTVIIELDDGTGYRLES